MNIALWILFGAIVGWIASLVNGRLTSRQAEIMTILGVVAGILGGWLANVVCQQALNDFNIYSVLTAVLASALGVWLYERHLFSQNK